MKPIKKILFACITLFSLPTQATNLQNLEHIVVIYLENRSFDNLFGLFPNANGLINAKNAPLQVDEFGREYSVLPEISDKRFPQNLPNQPFDIARYVSQNE